MLHQAGFDNACASMGTALTAEQIRLLSRYTKELILCYDNDNAGRIATQKALELLNDTDFSVRVLELPNRIVDGQPVKQDADDFIKNQGPDAFERLLSGSETGMDFRMARLAAGFDLTSDQGRIDYAAAAADLLAELPNAVEREIYTTPRRGVRRHLARRPQAGSAAQHQAPRLPPAVGAGKARPQRRRAGLSRRSAPSATTISAPPWRRRACCGSSARTTACSAMRRRCGRRNFPLPCSDALSRGCGRQRQESGRISLPLLAESFTPDEVSHLSTIVQKPESLKNAPQALRDYIRIIQEEYQKRSGAGLDPLAAATEKYKAQLGHGGKQHG